MSQVMIVAFGGALGSVLRFGVQKWLNLNFPFGTLTVNLLGCFIAGCLLALLFKGLNEQLVLFLMTGFCGGFTTFSAFSTESIQLLLADRWIQFFFYIIISVGGGLLSTFLAYKIFSA
jgi:fluoride exporter